jgi:hypothetical protein
MSSDLPAPVQQAGLLLQQAHIARDPQALEFVRQWGHAQINATYPDDPLRAPLNIVRRPLAHREWDQVVRTYGKTLRGAIMDAAVQDLRFKIELHQEQLRAEAHEKRRQGAVLFDTHIRLQELDASEAIKLKYDRERMQLTHHYEQESEDAASERRKSEHVSEAEKEVRILIGRAYTESIGTSSAQDMLDLVSKVNIELSRIRHDADLDDDDKHVHIKTLLDSLPHVIRSAKER